MIVTRDWRTGNYIITITKDEISLATSSTDTIQNFAYKLVKLTLGYKYAHLLYPEIKERQRE